jgi:hypothetical protein
MRPGGELPRCTVCIGYNWLMLCPQCRTEYRRGFTTCDECGIRLVDILPAEEAHEPEYSRFVTVVTAQGQFEEGQICSFLEAAGIPTAVRGEALRHTHGLTIDGIGAAHIMVPEIHADQARELLARAERGDLRIDDFSF